VKFNQVGLEDKPEKPPGFAFATGVVNIRDEFTERHGLLLVTRSHAAIIVQERVRVLWGVFQPPETAGLQDY
jgi:hypothetical protein